MDVSNIASAATAMSNAQTSNAVQMAVLKKAMDIGKNSAEQLIEALPQAGANPPNLGNHIDTYA
jgi:spore coat protein CotF